MDNNQIIEIKKLLSTPKNIVVVPHKNPDGDAIGACLAISHFLVEKGHMVTIVSPNDYPAFLKWLPPTKISYKYDLQNKQSKRAINNASVIFLLDFNALHRVGDDMKNFLEQFEGDFIMIDHHQQPEPIAKYLYSDISISSTCQMVYHFLEKMDEIDSINEDIATCLYTGIMTDTGSFRFPSTTSTTHKIIADLIEKGADNSKIHGKVYDTNSFQRLQLLGRALSQLEVIEEYRTAFIWLSQNDLNEFNYQKGDTEGIVNYALSLQGVIFGVIFIEDTDQKIIKISFRSRGSFSVNKFAREHFNGGGHINAAGGKTQLSLEETIDKFKNLLMQYKLELINSYET
jgi:phosphoesterase RecJ-like protein